MHRPLVAASLIAVSVMVGYAAVPLGVSPRMPVAGVTRLTRRQSSVPCTAVARSAGTAARHARLARCSMRQGAALAGAVVDASHEASGWRALALTDREGRFRLQGVPAGSVTLTVRRGCIEFARSIEVGTQCQRDHAAADAIRRRSRDVSAAPVGTAPVASR